MSYILEALKKTEQERRLGAVPRLDSGPFAARELPGRVRRPWLLGAVLAVNVLVLGGLAWHIWLRPPDSQAVVTAAAEANATDPVDAVPAPQPRTSVAQVTDDAPKPAPGPAAATASTDSAVASPAEPVAPSAPPAVSRPAVVYETTPAAGIPRWDDLGPGDRQGLVKPELNVHVYARQPARRFVLIDMVKHREGDLLASGAVVEAITAEGVVLKHRGVQYRIERP